MFTYIKNNIQKYWKRPYRFYDEVSSEDLTFFGVITLVSIFMSIALLTVGIVNLSGHITMPKFIGMSMIFSAVIVFGFAIVYGFASGKIQSDEYDTENEYDPNKVMVLVSLFFESLFSGFFFVMLIICIVVWFFTVLFYSLPVLIIKILTKPKMPKELRKEAINANEIANRFKRYRKARI